MNGSPDSTASTTERPWLLDLRPPEAEDGAREAPAAEPGLPPGLPPDALGLALSGGGVRGAAFGLGALQALARAGWLRHVDFLSTVSGGGCVGAFLGRYFDVYRDRPGDPELVPGAVQARVARGLIEHDSAPVGWLRRRANDLAPGGPGDAMVNFAGVLRKALTSYLVLGVALLALFGVLNAVGYSRAIVTLATRADDLIGGLAPLTRSLPEAWSGPWAALCEISLWLAAAPLMIAFWLVSPSRPEAFIAAVLVAAGLIAASLAILAASPLPLAILTSAALWAIGSWAAVRRSEGPGDPNSSYRIMLARDYLTRWLRTWLVVALALAAVAAIDGLGRWLAMRMAEGGLSARRVAAWLVTIGTAVLGAAAILKVLALAVASRSPEAGPIQGGGRRLLWTAAALLLGIAPALIALSFASHASYQTGRAYAQGLAVSAVATLVSLLLGARECVPFINRSGVLDIRAGRLARAFLGAVNPNRRLHPEGLDASRWVAGDGAPLDEYRPHLAGGPLHLINCAVRETVDLAGHLADRARRAESVAVGPVGLSVGREHHSVWVDGPPTGRGLQPLNLEPPDPLLSRAGGPVAVEPLTLQEWTAISAAAIGPDGDRRDALANAHAGYWWDSGLELRDRAGQPAETDALSRLGTRLTGVFRTQWLLLSALMGRFGGPWVRYWRLSGGCLLEPTGAYELLRRRLPFVVICDAGDEAGRRGASLARLFRIARIDLGAEIAAVDPSPESLRALGVPERVAEFIGSLDDVVAPAGGLSRKHAALLRCRYPEAPPCASRDPWLCRRSTWILYLKATLTGDEPADVSGHAASHPGFPDESASDRIFDESAWESYRKLGDHIGEALFSPTTGAPPRPSSRPTAGP